MTAPSHEVLFGNAERTAPRLSPDGRKVAYLAPRDGTMNLWTCDVEDPSSARGVTELGGTGLRPTHAWSRDGQSLIFLLDQDGNEQYHVHLVDLETGSVRDLTPFPGTHSKILGTSAERPHSILIALNKDEPTRHDFYELDLPSGDLTLVQQGRGHLTGFADAALRPRAGMRLDESGSAVMEAFDGTSWRELITLGSDDALSLILTPQPGLTSDGASLHLIAADGAETSGLLRIDLETGTSTRVLGDTRHDAEGALVDPPSGLPLALAIAGPRRTWLALDSGIKEELDLLEAQHPGDLTEITACDLGTRWLATFADPSGPTTWMVWDRATRVATTLFTDRPDLENCSLGAMESFSFVTRDGLTVHGYLTYPSEGPRENLPAVLYVHGGPWQRDSWTWNPIRQLLATRGYLCVQVNFRGSTGCGSSFMDAGDREWGGRMQDDLLDAMAALVERGIVDPERMAVFGGSYGGYAALVAGTFTPDVFKAVIAWCPPVNLVTTIKSFPAYWTAGLQLWHRRVGNPDTEPEFLLERSPVTRANQLTAPLLLVTGANDPRCPVSESDQIAEALSRRDIPHTYIVVPDEGHGFLRQENNIKLLGWIEDFLREHLPVSAP